MEELAQTLDMESSFFHWARKPQKECTLRKLPSFENCIRVNYQQFHATERCSS